MSEHNSSIYFPQPKLIRPFAMAFVEMMFAHADFEREVSRLQGEITGDSQFGERGRNQWSADKRPKKMAELIKRYLGTIPETAAITELLKDVIGACDRRNHLAHGQWWRFDPKTSAVTVRGARQRNGRIEWKDYTVRDISSIRAQFQARGIALCNLRIKIENRAFRNNRTKAKGSQSTTPIPCYDVEGRAPGSSRSSWGREPASFLQLPR